MALETVATTCNRDCPDACGILADVEDGRVVALRGDPAHPITKGFLCYRTSRFLRRQYHPQRILRPLLRRGERQVEIPLEEALDLAASELLRIKKESGPEAILHYQSGGSLGALKALCKYFFQELGPTSTKTGDICSGGGDAAQLMDFGEEDSNDLFDLLNARHIINWGKNLYVSNLHLIPIVKQVRAKGTRMITIDPVYTRSAQLSDDFLPIRPGGDIAFALAVARNLFETGRVDPRALERCDHLDELRALAFARSPAELEAEHDLSAADVVRVADALADGPTAILVGWGMQRRLRGATSVRMLDALSALSGNLWRSGGGSSFYFKRRGAFDTSFSERPAPRALSEPILGQEILAAKDPPIRAIWVTAANPVAMLPDSATVARAFEATELVIAVDAFPTDTTRRAKLVLPTTTLLEDDDLLGAYGHHWVGVSRPVVPAPDGVLTDLQLMQELARRTGLGHLFSGTARDWKRRILARAAERGVTLERVEQGAVRSPFAREVLFGDGRVKTPSGRVNLVHTVPPAPDEDADYPLWLFSNSTERAQSSQWADDPIGPITATVHPDAAPGLADGTVVRLESELGALEVRLVLDATLRPDVVLVPKGGHFDRGHSANALIRARLTDHGEGAAYLDTRVRLQKV